MTISPVLPSPIVTLASRSSVASVAARTRCPPPLLRVSLRAPALPRYSSPPSLLAAAACTTLQLLLPTMSAEYSSEASTHTPPPHPRHTSSMYELLSCLGWCAPTSTYRPVSGRQRKKFRKRNRSCPNWLVHVLALLGPVQGRHRQHWDAQSWPSCACPHSQASRSFTYSLLRSQGAVSVPCSGRLRDSCSGGRGGRPATRRRRGAGWWGEGDL